MRPLLLGAILLVVFPKTWAFDWQNLWITKNHQAQKMMNAGEFAKAQETFDDPAWQATAAYRAGNYKEAAIRYQSLKNNVDAYYNQANALAHDGQLESAIKAYNKALSLDPANKDALHNRKIVEKLLKKQKQDEQKQDKQEQNKQEQNKQEQDKQEQDKQEQNKQEQDKQEQDKQEQDKQEQDKQEQDKQEQDKQEQDKQQQNKQEPDKQEQDKQEHNKPEQDTQEPDKQNKSSQAEREQQQAKEQWLRLIPDDPGGLMREKFLRDYLRRHRN